MCAKKQRYNILKMKTIEPELIIKNLEHCLGYEFSIKSRKRHIVYARALYYDLAKNLTVLTLENIGKYVGKEDHAVVINGLKTFETIKAYEPEYMKIHRYVYESLRFRQTIVVQDVDLTGKGLSF